MDKLEKGFLALLALFSVLYLTWHFGRSYERNQVKVLVAENLSAEYIDYELPEFTASGKPEQVNCILDTKVDKLFQYAGLDY